MQFTELKTIIFESGYGKKTIESCNHCDGIGEYNYGGGGETGHYSEDANWKECHVCKGSGREITLVFTCTIKKPYVPNLKGKV